MNFGKYLRTPPVVAFRICLHLDYLLLFRMFPLLALSMHLLAGKVIE